MPILNKAELQAGGFNVSADEWAAIQSLLVKVSAFNGTSDAWAAGRGISQVAQYITTATTTVTNDPSKYYKMDRATDQILTIPADLTNWPIDSVLNIIRLGDGPVTVVGGSGVTILKSTTNLVLTTKNTGGSLLKLDTNTWIALGSFS